MAACDQLPKGREALRAGLPWLYVVETASMAPTLPVGAVILVDPCHASDLVPGDIVCLDGERRPLVHRFLRTAERPSGGFVVTRGDRNPQPDPPHGDHAVLGRVRRVYWGDVPIPLDRRAVRAALHGLSRLWPWTAPARGLRRAVLQAFGRGPTR